MTVWKFVLIGIALQTNFCLISSTATLENRIESFIKKYENIIFSPPSSATGVKVANWSPKDGMNPEELGDYAEGDIIMPQSSNLRNGLLLQSARWENGIIPYKISDSFNYKEYNTIMDAIKEFHDLTCVKWVRWSGEKDYVVFASNSTGCWSSVGRTGGQQIINLQSPGCLHKKGTVIHEMNHALGFLHEQSRHERDSHVTINWYNIAPGAEINFKKAEEGKEDGLGEPYDYCSVMHYSDHAFSKNGQPTIVPKNSGAKVGQRIGLSVSDVKKIRRMYKCDDKGSRRRHPQRRWPFASHFDHF